MRKATVLLASTAFACLAFLALETGWAGTYPLHPNELIVTIKGHAPSSLGGAYALDADLAEASAVVAMLGLAWDWKPTRLRFLKRVTDFDGFSRPVRIAFLGAGLVLFGSFVLMISVNTWTWITGTDFLYNSPLYGNQIVYGRVASGLFLSGLACLIISRSGKGLANGFKEVVVKVGCPTMFAFTTAIMFYDSIDMSNHIALFVPWAVQGVYLLNNWTLWVGSLALIALSVRRPAVPLRFSMVATLVLIVAMVFLTVPTAQSIGLEKGTVTLSKPISGEYNLTATVGSITLLEHMYRPLKYVGMLCWHRAVFYGLDCYAIVSVT